MTHRPARLAGALLLASIAGCASSPQPFRQDFAASVRRVSVVSVAADSLLRISIGPVVFANERSVHDIADWAVDRAYEERLAAAAEQAFKAEVVRDPVPPAAFAAVNLPGQGVEAVPNWRAIEDPVRQLCQERGLDAVLVVAKDGLSPAEAMYNVRIFKPQNRSDAHLSLRAYVGLLDCASGKPAVVQRLWNYDEGPSANLLGRINLPGVELPGAMGRAPMTSTWKPEVRARLIALPQSAWAPTLKAMLPAAKP